MIALMVGGPMDGQVQDVQDLGHEIRALAPPKGKNRRPAWFRAAEEDYLPAYREVIYRRTEMVIFGTTVPVYLLVDWPMERAEATLADLLLTDLAKRLSSG